MVCHISKSYCKFTEIRYTDFFSVVLLVHLGVKRRRVFLTRTRKIDLFFLHVLFPGFDDRKFLKRPKSETRNPANKNNVNLSSFWTNLKMIWNSSVFTYLTNLKLLYSWIWTFCHTVKQCEKNPPAAWVYVILQKRLLKTYWWFLWLLIR